ncbi:hypothetical protein Dcae01_03243 [Deinococcus caeni]|uniref:Uncharacterized protein n=2 Tax=Deinococcus caeni TaxID=569127 RepID=A0ABP9UG75_9DEIO
MTLIALVLVAGFVKTTFFPSAEEQCKRSFNHLVAATNASVSFRDYLAIEKRCKDGDWTNDY